MIKIFATYWGCCYICIKQVTKKRSFNICLYSVGWWNWQTHLLVSVVENMENP
jgi:hypothetical protein